MPFDTRNMQNEICRDHSSHIGTWHTTRFEMLRLPVSVRSSIGASEHDRVFYSRSTNEPRIAFTEQ